MDPSTNPYSPGSGLRPPTLTGREAELDALDVVVRRTRGGAGNRGVILSGLRGVGKTVLLNEMRERTERAGWFTISLEGLTGDRGERANRQTLARSMAVEARRLRVRHSLDDKVRSALQTVSSFSAKAGVTGIDVGVSLQPGRADTGDISIDLPELVQDLTAALREHGQGFGLFIDEMQDLDAELLGAILTTQHQAGQRSWPFYVFGAGLSNLPLTLTRIRSYAERLFEYRPIDRLGAGAAATALTDPAEEHGASFTPTALEHLLSAADGYPYFLQEYGKAVWDVAVTTPFSAEDAAAARAVGLARLDAGFFASRWERATPGERRLLLAMAADAGRPSAPSVLAERMGLSSPGSLGPYRARLIEKGLVYAPRHGELGYTVPGMAEFVRRHREDSD